MHFVPSSGYGRLSNAIFGSINRRRKLFIRKLSCCIFRFVCHHPVSCVPDVASVSGLFIIDCPFGFL